MNPAPDLCQRAEELAQGLGGDFIQECDPEFWDAATDRIVAFAELVQRETERRMVMACAAELCLWCKAGLPLTRSRQSHVESSGAFDRPCYAHKILDLLPSGEALAEGGTPA